MPYFCGVIQSNTYIKFLQMTNSVASFNGQVEGEIKLAATGERNVRDGFVDIASLSSVAVCYGGFKYTNHIMDIKLGFIKSSHFFK